MRERARLRWAGVIARQSDPGHDPAHEPLDGAGDAGRTANSLTISGSRSADDSGVARRSAAGETAPNAEFARSVPAHDPDHFAAAAWRPLYAQLGDQLRAWAHRRRWRVLARTRHGYDYVLNWPQIGADLLVAATAVALLALGAWVAAHGGTAR